MVRKQGSPALSRGLRTRESKVNEVSQLSCIDLAMEVRDVVELYYAICGAASG